jgi:predicted nucleotidyltransferase
MKTLGIIAEYDPFHNGHLYHLRESLRMTCAERTVCVMSGDFVQRGGPALTNKRIRAEAAVRGGIDLVIELPFVYASGNAEWFARGAVGILDGIGIADYLSFGSESGDVTALNEIAELFAGSADRTDALVKEAMKTGISYPAALEKAVVSALGASLGRHMKGANNTLGIEYLKELLLRKSQIKPYALKRHKASLNEADEESGIAGATAIREMLKSQPSPHIKSVKPFVPASSYLMLKNHLNGGGQLLSIDDLLPMLAYRISCSDEKQLAEILSATEGLEHRLIRAVRSGSDMAQVIRLTKTKRYTETRVRRLIAHTVVGLTKEAMKAAIKEPLYARVLAFNDAGAKLIRRIKKQGNMPLITNANREQELLAASKVTLSFDKKAADIYRIMEYGTLSGFDDLKIKPKKVEFSIDNNIQLL